MSAQRSDSSASERSRASFSARLEALYTAQRKAGRTCTDKGVAAAVSAIAGKSYSPGYLWKVRRGRKQNPSAELVAALAEVFQVNRAYFYDDEVLADPAHERPAPAPEAVSSISELDPAILKIAHRADGLSPHWLLTLDQLISHARQMEGLDDTDESR